MFYLAKKDASDVLKKQSNLNNSQKIILSKLVEFVPDAKNILKSDKKNFDQIGKLMNESWNLKKN